MPHLPQLFASVALFTHTPLHNICPGEQAGVVVTQRPLVQMSPAGQGLAAEQLKQAGPAQVPMPAAFQLVQVWPLGQGG